MRHSLITGFVAIILFSCSNDTAVSPDYSPGWQPPVVEGIILTTETGLEVGIWGNPNFPADVTDGPKTFLRMNSPYPNPASGGISTRFEISRPSKVKVWISPARGFNQPGNNYHGNIGGMLVDVDGGKAVEILLDGSQELQAGIYEVTWSNSLYDKDRAPNGFYRIYVQANGVTLWRDVYICSYGEHLPDGLKQLSCR